MDSQETTRTTTEPGLGRGINLVKQGIPISPGAPIGPQGPPLATPRTPINDYQPSPRPGPQAPQPLRRLDSRSSLGPAGPPNPAQLSQLRHSGPPRPPTNQFPPRPPPPGQGYPPNPQNLQNIQNPRFGPPQIPPGARFPGSQPGARPPFPPNFQQQQQHQQQLQRSNSNEQRPYYPAEQQPHIRPPESLISQGKPNQDSIIQRPLQRNESNLNTPRQALSSQDIRQSIRPRIIVENMGEMEKTKAEVHQSVNFQRRQESRENGENDDDDDVVTDIEKTQMNPMHSESKPSTGVIESKIESRPPTAKLEQKNIDPESRATTPNVSGSVTDRPLSSRSMSSRYERPIEKLESQEVRIAKPMSKPPEQPMMSASDISDLKKPSDSEKPEMRQQYERSDRIEQNLNTGRPPSGLGLNKLTIPDTAPVTPGSPHESVKGFDNGQRRSLSSRSSNASSPQSPISPNVLEKKKIIFTDDNTQKDHTKIDDNSSSREIEMKLSANTAMKEETQRAQTPMKQEFQNGGVSNGTQKSGAPTTNGVSNSPTKKTSSRETDKGSTAGSPTKSPSKSAKSLPKTPDTPTSTTSLDKKKVPMNKVQVGAAPSPNLKTVRSKIGSLDNTSYKPGGGKVKIENRKLDFSKAQPKIAAKNEKYAPSGGDKKISQVKLQWNAKSKIGSLENATYRPGGGDKKIETVKLDFKEKAKPKVGSKDNAKHVPGGGTVKSSATPPKTPQDNSNNIQTQKLDIKAESKIGSLDNVKHRPGGGDKKIFNDKDYLRQTNSNVESLSGSGSQVPNFEAEVHHNTDKSKVKEVQLPPQPPPSTPTKSRISSTTSVTARAIRSSLAKSPEMTPKNPKELLPLSARLK